MAIEKKKTYIVWPPRPGVGKSKKPIDYLVLKKITDFLKTDVDIKKNNNTTEKTDNGFRNH